MDFPTIDDEYEDAKRKAELLYKSIGEVWCPALNDYIIFDEAGFFHLVEKDRKNRPKSEQKRRFSILHYAKDILSSTQPESMDEIFINGAIVKYWKFIAEQNDDIIKVIVRQVDKKPKHFLSIYGRIKKLRHKA